MSVDFAEHTAEQFVIGQAVVFQQFHDRGISGDQVVIKMRDPHPVDMLGESYTEGAVEQAAEVFAAKTEFRSYFGQ